ncbi:MAG TPA: DUF5671 domain-containing protein [Candidatus Limnocylindria bacterium]
MAGAYRRFYLYSALSIALLALAVALTSIVSLALRMAGLALIPPNDADVRSSVSLAVAIALVAIPVGAVHLVIILRALGDPEERAANVRHFYLNLWIFVALVVVMFAAQVLATTTAPGNTGDRGTPIAAALVAAVVGVLGWRWRTTTPPRTLRWENDAAYGAMIIALLTGLPQLAAAVDGAARLQTRIDRPPDFPGAAFFLERQQWTGMWTFLAALAVWAICAVWQRDRRTQPIRLRYLLTFYALGVVLFAAFLDLELAGVARQLLGHGSTRDVITFLPQLAVGVALVAMHAPLLAGDRGRNGRAPDVVDRLLAAPVALVAVGLLAAGAAQAWTFVVEHVLALGGNDDPADHAAAIAVSAVAGLVSYPLSWRVLRAGATGDTARRFVVFTIVCLSLAGGVISAAAALFQLISGLLAGTFQRSDTYALATWAGIAVIALAVFVWHLASLRGDRRVVVEAAPARDALLETLEAVARGELTPTDAAARIRATG